MTSDMWKIVRSQLSKEDILIDTPYVLGCRIEERSFCEIQLNACRLLLKGLSFTHKEDFHNTLKMPESKWIDELLKIYNKTTEYSLHVDFDLAVALENSLVKYLKSIAVIPGISGLEYPPKVRVVHGTFPKILEKSFYPTDDYHTDIWIGEPEDSINMFIYLGGDVKRTYLDIFHLPEQIQIKIKDLKGPYKQMKELIIGDQQLTRIPYTPEVGMIILFRGDIIHKTMRTGGGVRLSIDIRGRIQDPYLSKDDRWNHPKIPHGKYWRVLNETPQNLEDKINLECRSLEKDGPSDCIPLRKGLSPPMN